jgi:hypothetical protein
MKSQLLSFVGPICQGEDDGDDIFGLTELALASGSLSYEMLMLI